MINRICCLCGDRQVPVCGHDSEVLDPVELAIEARDLDLLERTIINLLRRQESHQLGLSRGVVTSQDRSNESGKVRQHSRGVHLGDELISVLIFEEGGIQVGCTYPHPILTYRVDEGRQANTKKMSKTIPNVHELQLLQHECISHVVELFLLLGSRLKL